MHQPAASFRTYDPVRHDSHVIALFDDEASAGRAWSAVLEAGVPAERIVTMADGEALERSAPLSLEEHGRRWRGTPAPTPRFEINHANLSRADMHGRAIGGRDEVILDMTGQKMTVRMMSEADMAEAPFAPMSTPEQRQAPLAPPPPVRDVPVHGTSYTYGVPIDVVQRMSPEEQVLAQPHAVSGHGDPTTRGTFLRMVDGQTWVGWRDDHPGVARVRSYITERPIDPAS